MLGESEFKGRWLFMLARGLEGGGRDCPSARSAFELSLVMHVLLKSCNRTSREPLVSPRARWPMAIGPPGPSSG